MKALTPEEKATGKQNFYEAVGVSRRDFMKGVVAAGAVSGGGLGALYFGYNAVHDPVRIGVIGTGDEGNVLIGALNPDYQQVVAIADIRPYNIHRAFHGDWASDTALAVRCGLMTKYGWKSEDEARKQVKVYHQDYHDLINDPDVEAVVIALPLHLHAKAAIECMQAGKHVLTEKLMGHNVAQCKVMSRVAEDKDLYLATGHQRHYSVLYDNAVNLLRWGIMGQLHHIRAQWHRGNLPGRDSWQQPLPGGELVPGTSEPLDKIRARLKALEGALKKEKDPVKAEKLTKQVAQWRAWDSDRGLTAEDYDYEEMTLSNGRVRSAMEELCRWRLWARTGGGLMAELGSHQLDAASIFISAMRADGKKVHPLTVYAVGGRQIFGLDREAEDHVYCMFEFPGPDYHPTFDVGYRDPVSNVPDPKTGVPGYEKDPNKKIVVTYSSINGNGFGGYGEIVLGTKGTLVLEREQDVMLYKTSDTASKISVKDDKGGVSMDTQASGPPSAVAAMARAADSGPVSRGYTEELEHWAWCIRNKAPENQPRCKPEVAMGDAIIALAANVAIRKSMAGEAGFLRFDEAWFDLHSDETPDGSSIEEETNDLV
ncbi:MAG: Gfo/Idh/MocA family protein [Pirellulaceae bacterium]